MGTVLLLFLGFPSELRLGGGEEKGLKVVRYALREQLLSLLASDHHQKDR